MKDETKMDASRLITEVHQRPALWNQRHLSYHNRDVTNRIWMEIATIFKLPKQVLKAKWKGLRDTFRAEIKKEQVYRKSKYTSNRPAWIHFKTLQFLKEQMVPRPPIWERTDNSRDDNDATSGGSSDVVSEDGFSGIDVLEAASDNGIGIQTQRESWMEKNPSRDNNRPIKRRMSSHHPENLEILEDLAGGSNENLALHDARGARSSTTIIPVNHPDCPTRNNNNSSCINSISDNQIDETIIKLEPADNYENNVDKLQNIGEEIINNIDKSMLKKITTEEVIMGESLEDNCVIGGSSLQHAVDPLEVNRFDDNYHFFMSLLPHIRTLPAERRMLLRMQMQQLVYQEVYNKTPSSLLTCPSTHS